MEKIKKLVPKGMPKYDKVDDFHFINEFELDNGRKLVSVRPTVHTLKKYRDSKDLDLLVENISLEFKEYLESDMVKLPDNYFEYRKGGELNNFCTFCNDYISSDTRHYKVEHSDEDGGKMCFRCNFVRNQYKRHIDIKFSLENTNTKNIIIRRYLYEKDKKFVPNILSWIYKHPEDCYFCNDVIHPEDEFVKLHLPVSGNHYGGVLKAHIRCMPGQCNTAEHHWEAYDICRLCKESYPIDEEEASFRYNNGTEKQHYCPECYVLEHGDVSRYHYYNIFSAGSVNLDRTFLSSSELKKEIKRLDKENFEMYNRDTYKKRDDVDIKLSKNSGTDIYFFSQHVSQGYWLGIRKIKKDTKEHYIGDVFKTYIAKNNEIKPNVIFSTPPYDKSSEAVEKVYETITKIYATGGKR